MSTKRALHKAKKQLNRKLRKLVKKWYEDTKHLISRKVISLRRKIRIAVGHRKEVNIEYMRSRFRKLENQSQMMCPEDITEVFGLDEHINGVVSRLTGGLETCEILPIVGVRGVGKSTLAAKVYRNDMIVETFPTRAWVTLPPTLRFELDKVLLMITQQVIKNFTIDDLIYRVEGAKQRLSSFLEKEKYLIVLDDVQTSEVWNELQKIFPDSSNSSRILMTTSNELIELSTESDKGPIRGYNLQALSDEESWKLFNSKVHVPNELQLVGQKIVKKCIGIARVILATGELLSRKPASSEEWSQILREIDPNQISEFHVLNLAVNALPLHLKHCLLYFGLFREDYDIPVRRLIVLWIAEGLVVKEYGAGEPFEYVAEMYLEDLVSQNFIQVCKRKPDGTIKSCRMHNLLRDHWLSKAKEFNFLSTGVKAEESKSSSSMIFRLADHLDMTDELFYHIHGEKTRKYCLLSYYRSLRSFMSYDFREGPIPGKEIGRFFHRGINKRCFRRLRVIDLEGVFRPKLPKTIGKLVQLRYLGLRWTLLETLPSTIGSLLSLETLDLKHTYISILPPAIWKMRKLRHLFFSDSFRCRFVTPPSASSLINLQTLWGAFLDEDSPVKGFLDRLFLIRKLGLVCRLTIEQQHALATWIQTLSHLQSLRLRSIDEFVQPSTLYLKNLYGLKNLLTLYLCGRLENPYIIKNLPESLSQITLSISGLIDDPMPMLENLPKLRRLILLSNSYFGERMVCSSGGFPCLGVLKLWKLENLKELEIQKGALRIVTDIEVRSCKKLETIEGKQHLAHCHHLNLNCMSEEFKTQVSKSQEAH